MSLDKNSINSNTNKKQGAKQDRPAAYSRHGGVEELAKLGHVGFIERPNLQFLDEVKKAAVTTTSVSANTKIGTDAVASADTLYWYHKKQDGDTTKPVTKTRKLNGIEHTATKNVAKPAPSKTELQVQKNTVTTPPLNVTKTQTTAPTAPAKTTPNTARHMVIMHVPGPYKRVEPPQKMWELQAQEIKKRHEEQERLAKAKLELEERTRITEEMCKAHDFLHKQYKQRINNLAEIELRKFLDTQKCVGICVWKDDRPVSLDRRNYRSSATEDHEAVAKRYEADLAKAQEEADAKRQPRNIQKKQLVSSRVFDMLKRIVHEDIEQEEVVEKYIRDDRDQEKDTSEDKQDENEVKPTPKSEIDAASHAALTSPSDEATVSLENATKVEDARVEGDGEKKLDDAKQKQKQLDMADYNHDYGERFFRDIRGDYLLARWHMEKKRIQDDLVAGHVPKDTAVYHPYEAWFLEMEEKLYKLSLIQLRRNAAGMLHNMVYLDRAYYRISQNTDYVDKRTDEKLAKWWENTSGTRTGKMTVNPTYDSDDDRWFDDSGYYGQRYNRYDEKPTVISSFADIQECDTITVNTVNVDHSEIFLLNPDPVITSPIFKEMKQVTINGATYDVVRRSIASGYLWTFDLSDGGQLQSRKLGGQGKEKGQVRYENTHWLPLKICATFCEIEAKRECKHASTFKNTVLPGVDGNARTPIPVHLPWKMVQFEPPYTNTYWPDLSAQINQIKTFWSEYDKNKEEAQNEYAWGWSEESSLFECWKLENVWALELLTRQPVDPTLADIVKRRFIRISKIPVTCSSRIAKTGQDKTKDLIPTEDTTQNAASRSQLSRSAFAQETKEATRVANVTEFVKQFKPRQRFPRAQVKAIPVKNEQDPVKKGQVASAATASTTTVSQMNPFDALDQDED